MSVKSRRRVAMRPFAPLLAEPGCARVTVAQPESLSAEELEVVRDDLLERG